MALPYPTKVVLPFDIATAQDMNERHANDVALAAGTGLDDGAVTSSKMDLTTSVDANGWTVYSFGTSKHYTKIFTIPTQNIIAGGGLLTLTGNNIPSDMTSLGDAKNMQYSIRFNSGSPFVISNLDGAAAGKTTIDIGVSRPGGSASMSGSVYVSIWV